MFYAVVVDLMELPRPEIDSKETYLFADETEANKFRDHLRDLYELDVNTEPVEFVTYEQAIDQFVQLAGPSND